MDSQVLLFFALSEVFIKNIYFDVAYKNKIGYQPARRKAPIEKQVYGVMVALLILVQFVRVRILLDLFSIARFGELFLF